MTSKPESRLFTKKYRTISQIKGPLLFIERVTEAGYEEIVEVFDPNGEVRRGRLLEIDGQTAVAQLFVGTDGLDLDHTTVHFTGDVFRMDVSLTMLGRVFDGAGQPIDGGPAIIADESLDINGLPINPSMREEPREFIQTGISAIDGLNTLTRGQKLPVFSGSGLPGNKLLAQITEQARVPVAKEADEPFAVVFGAIGITHREASFFMDRFKASGAMDRTVVFINQANDPTIERLLTPRMALTAAEYLAFKHHRQVLVILTDMTNYCEALRELAAAREEVPGRRGYPGYMYSDLASIYERAGRVRENPGSVTQLILLTMPDDDITHPIPDLTGYITEGQIVLSRDLHRKGIFPPIDVLPSLSRLMDKAIGEGLTRADHRAVADQLYAFYAEGRDLRRLVEIIGESALSNEDQQIMAFTDRFEREFVGQGRTNRDIETTMRFAWEHLSSLPEKSLKRISRDFIDKFYQKNGRE